MLRGFEMGPQLCPHGAERRLSLGRLMSNPFFIFFSLHKFQSETEASPCSRTFKNILKNSILPNRHFFSKVLNHTTWNGPMFPYANHCSIYNNSNIGPLKNSIPGFSYKKKMFVRFLFQTQTSLQ